MIQKKGELKTIKISFLPFDDWKILKVLLIRSKDMRFTGFLLYLRSFNPHQNRCHQDNLDSAILREISKLYPETQLIDSSLISCEHELPQKLSQYKLGRKMNFEVNFFPTINVNYENVHEYAGIELTLYSKLFAIWHNADADITKFLIYDNITVYLDHNVIDEKVKSIDSIDA